MALNEIHAILKRTRYGTGSQWTEWSDLSNGAEGLRADERVTTRDNELKCNWMQRNAVPSYPYAGKK